MPPRGARPSPAATPTTSEAAAKAAAGEAGAAERGTAKAGTAEATTAAEREPAKAAATGPGAATARRDWLIRLGPTAAAVLSAAKADHDWPGRSLATAALADGRKPLAFTARQSGNEQQTEAASSGTPQGHPRASSNGDAKSAAPRQLVEPRQQTAELQGFEKAAQALEAGLTGRGQMRRLGQRCIHTQARQLLG